MRRRAAGSAPRITLVKEGGAWKIDDEEWK
jgi:hypothetical protein